MRVAQGRNSEASRHWHYSVAGHRRGSLDGSAVLGSHNRTAPAAVTCSCRGRKAVLEASASGPRISIVRIAVSALTTRPSPLNSTVWAVVSSSCLALTPAAPLPAACFQTIMGAVVVEGALAHLVAGEVAAITHEAPVSDSAQLLSILAGSVNETR